jgi:hypothetical protein
MEHVAVLGILPALMLLPAPVTAALEAPGGHGQSDAPVVTVATTPEPRRRSPAVIAEAEVL